jgi:hypothetical protein
MHTVFPAARRARRAAAVLIVLLSSACATGRSVTAAHGVILDVVNRGPSDVVVYVVEGGYPKRLRRVAGLQHEQLFVRRVSLSAEPIQLILRSAGSDDLYTPEIVWARPGEVVDLTIQNRLIMSELSLRQGRTDRVP